MGGNHAREVKQIIKALRKLNWSVEQTHAGHYKAVSPDKRVPVIIIPKSPSEYRGVKNLKALLRRHKVFV